MFLHTFKRRMGWGQVFACMFALLGGSGCFRQDVLTIALHVPKMRDAAQVATIEQALRGSPTPAPPGATGWIEGIVSVQFNPQAQQVSVTYDARRIARKNIEHLISAAGFDVNDIPAHAKTITDIRHAKP